MNTNIHITGNMELPRFRKAEMAVLPDVRAWLDAKDADVFALFGEVAQCPKWHERDTALPVTKESLCATNAYGKALLDYPHTWDAFDTWAMLLQNSGDPLTKADLQQTNDEGRSWMEQAARSGHFDTVAQYLAARGEPLKNEDLLTPEGEANAVFQAAVAWQQHGRVFQRDHWQGGSLDALQARVAALPEGAVKQIPNRFGLQQKLRMEQNSQHIQRGR